MIADLPVATVDTDAVVIGAGPVGLFQVFQLGLQELRAQVVDSLPHVGGQCTELYADKPIYDIPALRQCSGRELTERLQAQIAPFAAGWHLGQEVTQLERRPDGRFALVTSAGTRLVCTVVVIAAGVGAFQPRTLKLAGLERFAGTQLLHRLPSDMSGIGRRVVVAGNGEQALQAALQLAARHDVTLLHRRDDFDAEDATVARLRAALGAGQLRFQAGQATGVDAAGSVLQGLQVMTGDGSTHTLAVDTLLVLMGLSPRLGPIADWGLALERRQLVVDTAHFQTSERGIFAVGDINTYPGKRKLIVCGFHEATLAAFAAAEYARPQQLVQLQYTTTSTRLHRLLGVQGV